MVDTLYYCQQRDMTNFLEEEWMSSEPTSMLHMNNMMDHRTAMNLPNAAANAARGSGFLQPRMSPAFGQGVEDLVFTASSSGSMDGLGITHTTAHHSSRSPFPKSSSPKQNLPAKPVWYDQMGMGRSRSLTSPAPQSMPVTPQMTGISAGMMNHAISIAPHPASTPLRHAKRPRSDDQDSSRSPQRRRSNSTIQPPQSVGGSKGQTELSEEDQLLLKLKHDDNLPWKDIAREFETRLGRIYQVPALQMRHKRLRERMRTWTDDDISALEAACEYWEKSKFEIISHKMLEFGAVERWPAKYCERKWEELHPEPNGVAPSLSGPAPATSLPTGSVGPTTQDGWTGPELGSDVDYNAANTTMPVHTSSPTSFVHPVHRRSPGQGSPRSIAQEKAVSDQAR